jgi:hypothetical protein
MDEIFANLRFISENVLIISKGKKEVLDITNQKHDVMTKYIAFCLRLLSKQEQQTRYSNSLFHILASLDKIADFFKYLATFMQNETSEELYESTIKIHQGVLMFTKYFSEKGISHMVEFSKLRRTVKEDIKNLEKNYGNGLLGNLEAVLDVLLDLFESVNISE